ncbi:glutamate ABC transporter substrate-binding protein [Psychrobacillus sp. NPDC093180]|uniref:glutamate ABC transporter substrate-binding protein n=1 Tax=Psychrobacillus sp. NPDC093180 TaxID=3364489 RepID=UPI00380E60F0
MYKSIQLLLFVFIAAMILVACSEDTSSANSTDNNTDLVMDRIQKQDQITFGVKVDTRLFGLKNTSTGEIEGFDIDIAKAIAKEILGDENKVKFVEVNTKTRIPLLENDEIDAIIATMVITDERKKVIDFSDPYFEGGQSLLVKKGSEITGIDDLEGKKVITVKGATSGDLIREKVSDVQVLEFDTYFDAFSALKSGQGDTLTTDDAILYGMADEDPNYTLIGETLTNDFYGIGVKKGNEEFVEAINGVLEKLVETGEYDEIFNKWIKR